MNEHLNDQHQQADRVEIEYFTDPLCCWSWALEPHWRRLLDEFGHLINWQYRMGGLLPDWSKFTDPMNNVYKPAHMGPVWMEAKHLSGIPMNTRIWFDDPPASSYPACIAVKCAEMQSTVVADAYLQAIRKAVMVDGQNVAKESVLLNLAYDLEEKTDFFNALRFEEDLLTGKGIPAFSEDLQQVAIHNISRFPSMLIRKPGKPTVMITGYRPYEVLLQAVGFTNADVKQMHHK